MTKLNSLLAGLVAAIGFSGAALAQEATPWNLSAVESTKTRADVRSEVIAARQAGLLERGEASLFVIESGAAPKSRTQVMAEAREAQRLGVLSRGEVSVFATPAQAGQILSAGQRAIEPSLARAN